MTNEPAYLSAYRKIITSQFGEDGIIEKIFEIIEDGDRWCVEIGAGDGKVFSNTWNLVVNKDWSAVEIEANKKLYKKLIQTYKNNNKVICINKIVSFAGKDTLDCVLAETPVSVDFDLLCIDIEGNDYHVWNSIERYSPKVIVVEFNPTIPMDIEFVQPKDMKVNQGSSLLSLVKLGKKKGYELVAALDVNAFFVKKEYYPLFRIEDNSPHLVRKINKYETRLFQLYDGTLVLAGNKTLLWQAIEINQEEIQVLPKFLRKYPEQMNIFIKLIKKCYLIYRRKICRR
ncbi:MAG: FkbM family methyltransferase [Candidatus Omnitrophica bacterium]|nr:FkbM family methyltransferase [Candidatus Omnitrophota bacterium]